MGSRMKNTGVSVIVSQGLGNRACGRSFLTVHNKVKDAFTGSEPAHVVPKNEGRSAAYTHKRLT